MFCMYRYIFLRGIISSIIYLSLYLFYGFHLIVHRNIIEGIFFAKKILTILIYSKERQFFWNMFGENYVNLEKKII